MSSQRLSEGRRRAFLRLKSACFECLAPDQSGDEYEASGLCQMCLNGPLPTQASGSSPQPHIAPSQVTS